MRRNPNAKKHGETCEQKIDIFYNLPTLLLTKNKHAWGNQLLSKALSPYINIEGLMIIKNLCQLILFLVLTSFANIHPGLKNAIDRGDIKTAENLIKKFNVKDIYCPASLSYEDTLVIYEHPFSNNPSSMWEKCDSIFIKSAEKNVCKTSVPLCKLYLNQILHDVDSEILDTVFEDILQSKLFVQKEKRLVEKKVTKKASIQECLEQLENLRINTIDSVIGVYKKECREIFDEEYCTKMFNKIGTANIDSINKSFSSKAKLCNKKPTKTEVEHVEQVLSVNPFLYEIEYYNIKLSKRMKNPFYTNMKPIETYKKLKSVYIPLEKKDNIRPVLDMDAAAYCIAFPNKKSRVELCHESIKQYTDSLNLSSSKNEVIKKISNAYAISGFVSDSLITFSCKLYPKIDKDFYDVMEVNDFDCNFVSQYNSENEKCANSSKNYIQTFSSGIKYVCDSNKWRPLKQGENEYGVCSNEGDVKKNMYCAKNVGWIKNAGYKTFTDNRDNNVYRAVKIGDQIWMAENLNYKVKESRCYDDDKENCDKYGRLYTWYSIMSENDNGCMKDGRKECFEKNLIQGICPSGWHLPSKKEFEELKTFLEKNNLTLKSLKSIDEWSNKKNETDSYGFSAYPVGYWCLNGCSNDKREYVSFNGKGYNTSFWSSSIKELDRYYLTPYAFNPDKNDYDGEGIFGGDDRYGQSVRCLKDPKPKSDKNDVKKVGISSSYAKLRAKQLKEKKK